MSDDGARATRADQPTTIGTNPETAPNPGARTDAADADGGATTAATTPTTRLEPEAEPAPAAATLPPTAAPARDAEFDRTVTPTSEGPAAVPIGDGRTIRQEAYDREKAEFGGIKFGTAFFGWLSAMGLTVILTAVVAGTGLALGLGDTVSDAATDAGAATSIGIGGTVAILVILFVSYLAGGYVAGRMARFSGAKQGVAVWLWSIVIAIVLGVVAAIAGTQYNVLANLNTFPRIPINEGTLTATGIIAAVLAALVPLLAAVLGGIAGMRYHRRVDRVGLGR